MKLCRFALFALLTCAPAEAGVRKDFSIVGIYLQFDQPHSAAAIRSMKDEIDRVMKPAGLRFEFRDMDGRAGSEEFPDLLVLRFRGSCESRTDARPSRASLEGPRALARTAVSDGDVLPFSEIECDRVRTYISPLIEGDQLAEFLFGRALGRVAAHEMYHILVETKTHGNTGVGRAYHRAQELVAPAFNFDEPEARQLRAYAERVLANEAVGSTK